MLILKGCRQNLLMPSEAQCQVKKQQFKEKFFILGSHNSLVQFCLQKSLHPSVHDSNHRSGTTP